MTVSSVLFSGIATLRLFLRKADVLIGDILHSIFFRPKRIKSAEFAIPAVAHLRRGHLDVWRLYPLGSAD